MIISINSGEREIEILNFDYMIRRVEGDPNNNNLMYTLSVTVTKSSNYSQLLGTFTDYYENNSISSIEVVDEDNDIYYSTNEFTNLYSENLIFNVDGQGIIYTLNFQKMVDLEEINSNSKSMNISEEINN